MLLVKLLYEIKHVRHSLLVLKSSVVGVVEPISPFVGTPLFWVVEEVSKGLVKGVPGGTGVQVRKCYLVL